MPDIDLVLPGCSVYSYMGGYSWTATEGARPLIASETAFAPLCDNSDERA